MASRPRSPKVSVVLLERSDMPDLLERLKAAMAKGAFVKVGLLGGESKIREPGDPLTNVDIGIVNEFGSDTNPERSFLRRTFDRARAEYEVILVKFAGGIYDGKLSVDRALGLLGSKMAADVKGTVTRGEQIPPPNAPATIARKEALRAAGNEGEVRTLIDTGRMIGSLSWQVFMHGAPKGAETKAGDTPPAIPSPTPVPKRGKGPRSKVKG